MSLDELFLRQIAGERKEKACQVYTIDKITHAEDAMRQLS
jgi:hypothetical protein